MRLIVFAFLAIGCKKVVEPDPIPTPVDCTIGFADRDGDGFGGQLQTTDCQEPVVQNSDDCDDGFSDVNPDGREVCDERDNDCDGLVDLDDPDNTGAMQWPDTDGDGFGAGTPIELCEDVADHARDNTDCDDTDPNVSPDSIEICDGIDNDCDLAIDDDDDNLDLSSANTDFYEDLDGDGYGQFLVPACVRPAGAALLGGDCDDNDDTTFPGNTELCNDADSDCDGAIDGDGIEPDYCMDYEGEFESTIDVTLTQGVTTRVCSGTVTMQVSRTATPPVIGFFTCTFENAAGGFMMTQSGTIEGDVDINGSASGMADPINQTSRAWTGTISNGEFNATSSGQQIDPTTSNAWNLSMVVGPVD